MSTQAQADTKKEAGAGKEAGAKPAAAGGAAAGGAAAPSYASASLYVGDLHQDVTEGMLFELFNGVGPVASIRVCRDTVTRRSLGYAYVNFHSVVDAERALDTLNNTEIKGKICRIMWSQRDPSVRKSGAGNIFIKNLDESIDHKTLNDTFSIFGNILSCKVVADIEGNSKGYGFVHYDKEESALKAIEKVNGMIIAEKQVTVTKFVPKKERVKNEGSTKFTNIYAKNLPEAIDSEEKLIKMFEEYGKVTSAHLAANEGEVKGFGFVNYEEPESAAKAIAALHEKDVGTEETPRVLFVSRAQKKAEREQELRRTREQIRQERQSKYQGSNVFVKNLEDLVDDDKLREEFTDFGTITSAKVMLDDKNNSKGFGFVCFSTPEEATRAVQEMNGRLIGQKPIYVALAQRREVRRAQLEQQHARRGQKQMVGMAPGGAGMYGGGAPQVFYAQPGMQPNFVYAAPPAMMARGRGGPAWGGQGQAYQAVPPQGQQYVMPVGRGQQMPMRGGQVMRGGVPMQMRGGANAQQQRGAPAQRGQQQQQQPRGAASQDVVQQMLSQPLDPKAITTLPAEQQKLVVGEKLYPLIAASQPELAGKITGMLLDSYFTEEIIHLIETPEALQEKIREAIDVLQDYQRAAA